VVPPDEEGLVAVGNTSTSCDNNSKSKRCQDAIDLCISMTVRMSALMNTAFCHMRYGPFVHMPTKT